jgi:gliding motility-associated-like protein
MDCYVCNYCSMYCYTLLKMPFLYYFRHESIVKNPYKMLKRIAKQVGLLLIFVLFIGQQRSFAQMIGADIFMQGNFVEEGIATNGAYGTAGNAPGSYHARPDFGLVGGPLGFVADPAKDGWMVSSPGYPTYFGDYFLPGTPQEGWDIQVNGSRGEAWRGVSATSFTGGLTGSNSSYTATATQKTAVWNGSFGNLAIRQTTMQKIDKVYFVARIELTNTGPTTLTNIYYNRSLDPEPDATIGGNYSSDKRIIFQPTVLSKNCLIVATGQDYVNAYVGLGSKDCRAKCYITSTYTPDAPLNNVYGQSGSAAGYIYNVNGFSSANTSMGIVFNVGNLAPGEKTELAFAYILKQADLDSALSETAPSFVTDSGEYASYTTFRVCPGRTIPLKIKGGSAYKWTWTPGTDLSADSLISVASLPPSGGAYGDSVMVTVNGPRTYVARGISLCDTLQLTFYVDTISFSVPPYVTTPVKYCQGATPSALSASGASGATVLWSTTMGGPETTIAPTPSTAVAGSTRYYVRQKNLAGCFSQYAHIDVQVIAKPEPPIVHDTVYCFAETAVPVSAIGTNIQWYNALTGGTKYPSTPIPSTTGTTINYYPSQTVNGCVSDRATLKVDISKINAGFTISKDSLCGTELLNLTNNGACSLAGAIVPFKTMWWFGDGDTATAANPSHSYTQLGLYTIKQKVADNFHCADSTTRQVFVSPKPHISFTHSDSLICQGDAIDFAGKATDGYYQLVWDFNDGDVKSYDLLNVRQAFTTAGRYTVYFKASYSICGTIDTTSQIEVTEVPKVNIGRDTAMCVGNTALVLKNQALGAATLKYMWSTGDTTSQITVRQIGDYWLRVSDRNCLASDSISVTKACYLDVPNAFVPGDDNPYNAYFLPRSLLGKSIVTFDMKIYDRWGLLLFETTDVQGRGWDGKYHNELQPYGVYVYQIKVSFANGVTEHYTGNVTLMR